jgi:hypothetical protein
MSRLHPRIEPIGIDEQDFAFLVRRKRRAGVHVRAAAPEKAERDSMREKE